MPDPDLEIELEPAKKQYDHRDVEVDMRICTRMVEAILRRYIHFPERLDDQVRRTSYQIASEVGEYFLVTHAFVNGSTKGNA